MAYQLNTSSTKPQKAATKLAEQIKKVFLEAAKQFKLVNHWRGLCETYRMLDHLISRQASGMEQPEKERLQYTELHRKYLNYYDVQRFSDSVDTDLTIHRSGGEELSLMTELVLHRKPNTKLFEEPDIIVGDRKTTGFRR